MVVTGGTRPRVLRRRQHLHARRVDATPFKVNFCKFTNETRLASRTRRAHSGHASSSPRCNGTAAGGGYELALACDEILLVDDGNSRGVAARGAAARRAARHRRPHAPRRQAQGAPRPRRRVLHASPRASRASARWSGAWSTRSRRARSSTRSCASARRQLAADAAPAARGPGVDARRRSTPSVDARRRIAYRHVDADARRATRARATLDRRAPASAAPTRRRRRSRAARRWWPLRAFRELDDALLRPALRPARDRPRRSCARSGDAARGAAPTDALLAARATHWFVREVAAAACARAQAPRHHRAQRFYAVVDAGLVLRRHAARARARRRPHLHARSTTRRPVARRRQPRSTAARFPMAQRPHAPRDALPRRRRTRVDEVLGGARGAARRRERRRARPRHRRARRDRLGRRAAHRDRGARARSRPTR